MITTSRQIVDLQRRLNAVADRMSALNEQAKVGARMLTSEETARWQADEVEASNLSRELGLLRAVEEQAATRARPMDHPLQPLAMPGPSGDKRFKGQAFTRYVGALALSRGNLPQAIEIAQPQQHAAGFRSFSNQARATTAFAFTKPSATSLTS